MWVQNWELVLYSSGSYLKERSTLTSQTLGLAGTLPLLQHASFVCLFHLVTRTEL